MIRILLLFGLFLFGGIATLAYLKKEPATSLPILEEEEIEEVVVNSPEEGDPYAFDVLAKRRAEPLPDANRVKELFNVGQPQFPFVETIRYSSRTPWLKGRAAWLSDYASHYKTSRHFIARSLNGKADYLKQDVAEGDRFTVFKEGSDVSFYLVVDAQCCRLWLYAVDEGGDQRWLVKTYPVGLGRPDPYSGSGLLTPYGRYRLGSKVAIYKPSVMGVYNGEKTEMIRVFGTRWIPFEEELGECTTPCKGLGIHGLPWDANDQEETSGLLRYESDGCIRLKQADIEEIFAIIITRPSTIEIVRNFKEAQIPGQEV